MKNGSGPFESEIIRHPSDFSQLLGCARDWVGV